MKEKILVIEDDVQISNFIMYTLENEGFSVKGVTKGREGLCHIKKEETDLAVSYTHLTLPTNSRV